MGETLPNQSTPIINENIYHDSAMKLNATNFERLEKCGDQCGDLLSIGLRDQSLSSWRNLSKREIRDVFRRNVGVNIEVVRSHDGKG